MGNLYEIADIFFKELLLSSAYPAASTTPKLLFKVLIPISY